MAARDAPVTEFAPFNIDLTSSDQDKSAFEDKVLKLLTFVTEEKAIGPSIGWGEHS